MKYTKDIYGYALKGAEAELADLTARSERVRAAIASLRGNGNVTSATHKTTTTAAAAAKVTGKPMTAMGETVSKRMKRYWKRQRSLAAKGLPSRIKAKTPTAA